jgi:hypothetical protein
MIGNIIPNSDCVPHAHFMLKIFIAFIVIVPYIIFPLLPSEQSLVTGNTKVNFLKFKNYNRNESCKQRKM